MQTVHLSTVFLLPSARAPLPTFWLYTCVQGRAERSKKGAILPNINDCRWNNGLILTAVVLAELYFLVKEKGSRRLLFCSCRFQTGFITSASVNVWTFLHISNRACTRTQTERQTHWPCMAVPFHVDALFHLQPLCFANFWEMNPAGMLQAPRILIWISFCLQLADFRQCHTASLYKYKAAAGYLRLTYDV